MNPESKISALPWRRRRLWVAAWLLASVAILILVTKARRQPSLGGRTAESWLLGVFEGPFPSGIQTNTFNAFQTMGTNGIAFLVEALDGRDFGFESIYQWAVRHSSGRTPGGIRLPDYCGPFFRATAASLILMNVRDTSPEETLSRLIKLLASRNPGTRMHTAGVVQHYAQNYPQLNFARYRPQLIQALRDPNEWVRLNAGITLKAVKLDGPELVPALQPSLTNSNRAIRDAAMMVLGQSQTNHLAPFTSPDAPLP